jgi:hypothetical protein
MRLFEEQGYAATAVDQIAEAAEVSQSTLFRYFPTKEDVVLTDDFDPLWWWPRSGRSRRRCRRSRRSAPASTT